LESLESQKLRRDNVFEYAGEINCGRTRREEKQRSKPLDFEKKSSKDRKKAHAQLGEHNCRWIRPKERSGPLNFHVQIATGERIGRE
jgi:hypothetical protein